MSRWSVSSQFSFCGGKTRFSHAIATNKGANCHNFKTKSWNLLTTRQSKIVSRATGRRAVTSVDHSQCARVLKEIQRYHGPSLWAWRKLFSPPRGTNSTTTQSHIFGAIPWQVSQRLLLWTFWGWTAQEVLNPPFLTSKSYDEHLSPFLTKRSQNGSIFRCLFKREIFNFV